MRFNLKPALTIEQQIDLLKQRGMLVENESMAASTLLRTNYYRFIGYAFLFQKPNDQYYKGTSFSHITCLMDFDSDLRQVLMVSLEYIEIYARAQIAHWFALNHGMDGGAHYDASLFANMEYHNEYLSNLEAQIKKNESQPFVQHHIQSFNGKMPIWSAVEILSFSMLSKLYGNMLPSDKELIAANMNTDTHYLSNWLHCFSVLRNTCAHYSRLYRNVCSPKVSLDGKTLRNHSEIELDTLFAYIIAMLRIMPDTDKKDRLYTGLESVISRYQDVIELSAIGFPENWNDLLTETSIVTLKPVSAEKKLPIKSMH